MKEINMISQISPVKELRAFTVLDLENQCGGADKVPYYSKEISRQFKSISLPVPTQTVVAVGTMALSLCPQLAFDFQGARILSRAGIDGADKCLCEVLLEEATATRSKYVVIGSGDNMFAEPAEILKANGSTIIVVARRGSLSYKLYKVADQVIYLNDKAFHQGSTDIKGPA
jgi:hypothetical protein